jgi:hypothetical protein
MDVATSLFWVVVNLVRVLIPWLPLLSWIGYWLFAVNWSKALPLIMGRFGWVGIVLMMLVATIVWGSVAPPETGAHSLLGLSVSNYVGKFIYVTFLTCIAFLSGAAQLSGAFGKLCEFPEPVTDDDHHGHDDHSHGEHSHGGGHGHGDHGVPSAVSHAH